MSLNKNFNFVFPQLNIPIDGQTNKYKIDKMIENKEEQNIQDSTTADEGSVTKINTIQSEEKTTKIDFLKESIIQLALQNGLDTTASDTEVHESIQLIEKSGLSMRDAGSKICEALKETWSLNIVRPLLIVIQWLYLNSCCRRRLVIWQLLRD